MEVAVANGVSGIDADCRGACACGTCHVYIDEEWRGATGTADENEKSMLEFTDRVKPNSRLSCQIQITGQLDGLILHIPERPE